MQIIILCIGYVCVICVAAALAWTAVYYREKDQTPRTSDSIQSFGANGADFQVPGQGKPGRGKPDWVRPGRAEPERMRTGQVLRGPGIQRNAGQYWRMELLDTTNGDRIEKNFRGSVVLGRTQTQAETPDRCYVGRKQTISRRQCLIRESGSYLVVENLSQVNMTLHNNRYLEKPYYLSRGDHLNMGGSDYVVTRLDYIA
ncbi:MAG: FHA domain-containing protein [Lachnospiraceae bacterium]|nr:FHA domain-containing protein [Lachnospiraceae bacterium]